METHQNSFKRYHPDPLRPLFFIRLGVHNPHQKLQSLLCREWEQPRNSELADTFTGSIQTKAH